VTVAPDTVQTAGVCEEKATASPEEALAETPKGGSPKVRSGERAEGDRLRGLDHAEEARDLGCRDVGPVARLVGGNGAVPAPTMVTVVPDTVQTAVVWDEKVTVRPADEVADTVNGGSRKVRSNIGSKVIDCGCSTLKVRVTCGAGS
jgi:hypothetical protein